MSSQEALDLVVHIEPSLALEAYIEKIVVRKLDEAIAQARAARQANPHPGTSPGAEGSAPPPQTNLAAVQTCLACRLLKGRAEFSAIGWARGLCLGCEGAGAGPARPPEPTTPEWLAARALIPGLQQAAARLNRPDIANRLAQAHERFDHIEINEIVSLLDRLQAAAVDTHKGERSPND